MQVAQCNSLPSSPHLLGPATIVVYPKNPPLHNWKVAESGWRPFAHTYEYTIPTYLVHTPGISLIPSGGQTFVRTMQYVESSTIWTDLPCSFLKGREREGAKLRFVGSTLVGKQYCKKACLLLPPL